MVPHSCGGGRADRYNRAPCPAQAMVPAQAGVLPGFHGPAERSAAGHVHFPPLSHSTANAAGASWLPGFTPAGVGRGIPGHSIRSERGRVGQLAGKVKKMAKPFQFLLLAVGVIALLVVVGEATYSIAATTHGNTPARVVRVHAGPYPLAVSLYTYPAHASYALPFAIAPRQAIHGALTYDVT